MYVHGLVYIVRAGHSYGVEPEPEPEVGSGGVDYSAYYTGDAATLVEAATASPAIGPSVQVQPNQRDSTPLSVGRHLQCVYPQCAMLNAQRSGSFIVIGIWSDLI